MEITRKYDTYTWSENGKRIIKFNLSTHELVGKSGKTLQRVPEYVEDCPYAWLIIKESYRLSSIRELIDRLISLKILDVPIPRSISDESASMLLKKENWKDFCTAIKDDPHLDINSYIADIQLKPSKLLPLLGNYKNDFLRSDKQRLYEIEKKASVQTVKELKKFIKQWTEHCQINDNLSKQYLFLRISPAVPARGLVNTLESYVNIIQRYSNIISLPPLRNYYDFNDWYTVIEEAILALEEKMYFDSLPDALTYETNDYVICIPKTYKELEQVSDRFGNCAAHYEYNEYLKTGKRYLVWAKSKNKNVSDICIDMNVESYKIEQALKKFNRNLLKRDTAEINFVKGYQEYLYSIKERN